MTLNKNFWTVQFTMSDLMEGFALFSASYILFEWVMCCLLMYGWSMCSEEGNYLSRADAKGMSWEGKG